VVYASAILMTFQQACTISIRQGKRVDVNRRFDDDTVVTN